MKLRIALAQLNPTVGDLGGNVKKIVACLKKARAGRVDIIAFPELVVTGYPPEDLLLKPQFIKDNIDALGEVRDASRDIIAVVGFVDKRDEGIYNAAAVISNCRLVDVYHKRHLPNYGVFDEYRYFQPGRRCPIYDLGVVNIGVNICEDIWYEEGPVKIQAASGADIIININASPYHMGKASLREETVSRRAKDNNVMTTYVNMVGGQDELVFDGGSFVVNKSGVVTVKANQFKEELLLFDVDIDALKATPERSLQRTVKPGGDSEIHAEVKKIDFLLRDDKPPIKPKKVLRLSSMEEVYNALLLGTRDYIRKNEFKGVVIGLSGGIDSSLVATIAVDAIGKENVHGLFMPSPYTSKESYEDAYRLAKKLGIKMIEVPIDGIFKTYLKALSEDFKGRERDITEENLQARIRGNILMAFSNKFGWLVLTTGNKSEMSVGYATLYGDMAGGFAVIKDVPKTMVYDLCKWRNEKEGREIIPKRVLWKEPSAELKPDQRDTDTLPSYPVLDSILKAYVEEDKSFDEILKMGCEVECAQKVVRMIDRSEYKRRQSPPGIKITPRAFGKDRRFPITNKYRSY